MPYETPIKRGFMQLDADMAAVLGIASSLFAAGLSYGISKAKIKNIEDELEKYWHALERQEDRYVTLVHFDSVITGMREQLSSLEDGIKQILSKLQG